MTEHIKIGDVAPRIQFVGDGSQTVFVFPFAIFAAADLKVYVDNALVVSGYLVNGAGDTNGGNVTFDVAPSDGSTVTLIRELTIQRTTDFQDGGEFRAQTVNDELDRQTAFIQQVAETTNRSVQLNSTDPTVSVTLPSADDRKNRLLGFGSDGEVRVLSEPAYWRGDWVVGASYQLHDSVREPASKNIYFCLTPHVSTVFSTDLAAGKWQIAVEVDAVENAKTAAEAARDGAQASETAAAASAASAGSSANSADAARAIAQEWASNDEDLPITGNPGAYSAKHWAAKAADALPSSTVKASQAQAEAGTDNTTYMTPLRSTQLVDARTGSSIGDLVELQDSGGSASLPAVDGSAVTGLTQETFRGKADDVTSQFVAAFVDTKINFPVEDWDLNNSFDTSTSRFTPKVAGKYVVISHVRLNSSPAASGGFSIALKKNGSNYSGSGTAIDTSVVNVADLQHVGLVDLNGTTDYVEWYAFGTVPFEINSGSTNTNAMAFRIAGE